MRHGRSLGRTIVLGASCAWFSLAYVLAAARGADAPESLAASLKFVPADVSSYMVQLHCGELIDLVAKSHAWQKFLALPLVQSAWNSAMAEGQVGEGLDQIKDFFAQPENQELLALLQEMIRDEVFSYSDEQSARLLNVVQQVQTAMNYGPLFAQFAGGADPQTAQGRAVLDVLDANRDQLKIPQLMLGFKIRDKGRAERQLARLTEIAHALSGDVPELNGRFSTEKVGAATFLKLSLDGGLIPWDDIDLAPYETTPGQYDKLVEHIKALKLTIAVGLRDDFLLISVGESLAPLAKLGQGPRLAERAEFKQLTPLLKEHVYSISYLSKEFRNAQQNDSFVINYVREKLDKAATDLQLADEVQKRIQTDLKNLSADYQAAKNKIGASLEISFRAPRGIDGFSFDWSANAARDGSRPLTLLDHVGGAPLAFSVSRSKSDIANYDRLVKWANVAYKYFEDFGVPTIPQEGLPQYKKFKQSFLPLIARLDQTTRNKLYPALMDGQFAFVLDAQISSKQWFKPLTPTKEALPMIEPALVWGVTKADLLKAAIIEYRDALNDFFSTFNLEDSPLALFRIPDADAKELKTGTIYSYNYLELAGFDKQFNPNAGLSSDTAVLSISPRQTEQILSKTPLAVEGLLAEAKGRPLASASYVNWAGICDTATPLVDQLIRSLADNPAFMNLFGVLVDESARPKLQPIADDPAEVKAVIDQAHAVIALLKVWQSTSSITYQEAGVWVTHHSTVYQDVP
ncbi:MAG TPA: hypothetical protein VFE24_12275 [Pirellulales bacterium]|nr:hypothetical protein [Pirellulales bacterium]